jgi:chromosomal replication initiation ATPase DnaA
MSYNERNALLELVAMACGVTIADILGRSRYREHVQARRRFAMEMLERGCEMSYIGRVLGRDHTTIMHLVGARPARIPRYLGGAR